MKRHEMFKVALFKPDRELESSSVHRCLAFSIAKAIQDNVIRFVDSPQTFPGKIGAMCHSNVFFVFTE